MDEKKKNDELQSRREFFKNAAKRVLPIVGAIALSNPIVQASTRNEAPCNCYGTCAYGCTGTCSGGCSVACSGSCKQRLYRILPRRMWQWLFGLMFGHVCWVCRCYS